MTKKILIALFIFLCIGAKSQDLAFIVHANPSINWLSSVDSDIKTNGSKMGYDIGFELERYFSTSNSFIIGISTNSVGFGFDNASTNKIFSSDLDESKNSTLRTQSLMSIVGLKHNFEEIGYTTPYINGHFYNQYCYSSKVTPTDETLSSNNIENGINKMNYGIQLGMGIEYAYTRSTGLVCGIVYSTNFYPVLSNYSGRNSCLALRLALRFF